MKIPVRFAYKIQYFVSKGPNYHFNYIRWRLEDWVQKKSRRSFDVDNKAFLNSVKLESPSLRHVKQAADNKNIDEALINLAKFFQTRTKRPAFHFRETDSDSIIALIPNEQKDVTIKTADEVCKNVFSFRAASPVEFKNEVDWTYRPQGNIDWTWDLNRHTYFETLGRAFWYTNNIKYAVKFRELLLDWIAKNPPNLNQPNWHSVFEVAFRINTWTWAFYYFRATPAFDNEVELALLKGLLTHGRYLNTNIELHVPNNHLLLEAKALALLGILFPEFKEANNWRQRGLKILYKQIQQQVCEDGVHGERSTHYHRVIAGELLELFVLMANNDLAIPEEIRQIFEQMIEFELWATKPDGLISLLGDSALADTYMRFSAAAGGPIFLDRPDLLSSTLSLNEATIWLLGHHRIQKYKDNLNKAAELGSRAFLAGGYVFMRAGQAKEAKYLVFDSGPFGYKPLPSHGHADALSIELYAFGQTLLVDPGVYSTSLGHEWRNFFRGTRAHNTIVVDNQDQSILLDTRRVYKPAQTTVHQWLTHEHFDFVDASHNGYQRLTEPITHRRQICFIKPEYWIIVDTLEGTGEHEFDLYYHLMPNSKPHLNVDTHTLQVKNGPQTGLVIAPLQMSGLQSDIITGTTAPIQGWASFFSGKKQAAPTLRYHQKTVAPTQFCTILYPHDSEAIPAISISSLKITDSNGITGLCIELDEYLDYLVLDRTPNNRSKSFANHETDAELFYARHKKITGTLEKVISLKDSQLRYHAQPLYNQQPAATAIHTVN